MTEITGVSSSTAAQSTEKRRRKSSRQQGPSLVRRLLIAIGVGLLVLMGFWLVRTGIYGYQAYRSSQDLLAIARANPNVDDLPQVQATLSRLASATQGVNGQIAPLAPVLAQLDFLPGVGGMLAATPTLLQAGSDLTALGHEGLAALAPAMRRQGPNPSLDGLFAAVAESAPALAELQPIAASASAQIATIPSDRLPPALAEDFASLQAAAPLLPAALETAPALSALLGFDRPVTYLVLVQNNHELRGTGGFISAVGTLTFERGKPTTLEFSDSYDIFQETSEYAWAPEPMRRYMGIELLLLRDANWSPDFPSSAALASALYTQDVGTELDGVVSIDLRAVQLLVEALGRIQVEGTDEPITGANIVEQVKRFFDQPLETEEATGGSWWEQRKDFMPALAGAALQRIESGNVNYASLMLKLVQALQEGAIQIWVKDPGVMDTLAEAGWDGGMHPENGADLLFYTDTNMGYNKVDSVLERSLDYQVTWPDAAGEAPIATVTMTYRHPIEVADHGCDPTPRYGETYDDMAARCYFDYVRLYAPGGSTLIEATGLEADSVTSERGEAGTQRFSGYFVMEPGTEHTVSFTYELPPDMTPDGYRLVLLRQSGTGALPVSLRAGAETLGTTLNARRTLWEPGALD
jgi:hypothetical protein